VEIAAYESKTTLLERYATGRNVLHLGAVGETCGTLEARVAAARGSVHADITRIARACVGVDYDWDAVAALAEHGLFDNIICADATTLKRHDVGLSPIEIIVAGDILEHLSCPGALCDAARALADEDTLLVVTTPNALGLMLFVRNTLGRSVEGRDHVCGFNIHTLTNLLEQTGWQPIAAYTCHQKLAEKSRWFRLGRALFRLMPRWGGTLCVVAKSRPGGSHVRPTGQQT
jgi:hypothetical protein